MKDLYDPVTPTLDTPKSAIDCVPADPRILQLLDELIEPEATPEEVCRSCPELLPEVRARWRQMCRVRAELDAMFPPQPAPETGTVPSQENGVLPSITGYEVEAVLGQGGVGVVFRARDLRLGRRVALKMLLAGAYAGRSELARFQREAEAVASLSHANIVQIYEVGDHEGRPYFTMELVNGGSLAQKLAAAPLPIRRAAELVASLADAMTVAHGAGIVHRDLKPANVLLTADGVPKISDFGLARRLEGEDGLTGTAVGTPSYMAPEQASGTAGPVGPSADVYGLGAVLYELLTGRPPFRGGTALETFRQVLADQPIPPSRLNPQVPRDLETLCLKCLQKEPQRRYSGAAALADDLRRFLEGRPLLARPVGWAERTWRWCRRNPTLAALLVMALALVGLAVGGGFWLERQKAERREETARLEGQQSTAAESLLEQVAALQKQGRWPQAKAVLEGAPSLMDIPALTNHRKRLDQALTDVRMVTRLEDIPIRQVEVRAPSAHRQYVDAFRQYGIDLPSPAVAAAAARIRASAIREPLLAFIHDWWFHWGSGADQEQLAAVLDQADDDHWRRRLRKMRRGTTHDPVERHDLMQAPEAPDQPPLILGLVYSIMSRDSERVEALALLRAAQLRHPEDYWINLQLGGILMAEHPGEAVGYFRAAVASRPESSQAYIMLGRAMYDSGDTDGAIAAFRKAIPLTSLRCAPRDLAKALASRGGLEEARIHWAKMLEPSPRNYDPWDGYALLCAFLGNEEAYRAARKALLERFRDNTEHWTTAERDGQACLILPAADEELRRAVELVDRAVETGETFFPRNSWIQFAEGLSGASAKSA